VNANATPVPQTAPTPFPARDVQTAQTNATSNAEENRENVRKIVGVAVVIGALGLLGAAIQKGADSGADQDDQNRQLQREQEDAQTRHRAALEYEKTSGNSAHEGNYLGPP